MISILYNDFWGFGKYISAEIRKQGYELNFFDGYDVNNEDTTFKHIRNEIIFRKIIYKLFKIDINISANTEYYLKSIKNTKKTSEIIVIFNPNEFSIWTILLARRKSKKLVAYFFDSLDRTAMNKKLLFFFDIVYSFDYSDSLKYNFKHLPNFIYLAPKEVKENFDSFIIMLSSSEREKVLLDIHDELLRHFKINNNIIIFGDYRKKSLLPEKYYTKKRYSLEESFSMLQQSRIVIDILRENQSGLSFRILEALSAKKKVITNNKYVRKYNFYCPSNFFIIEDDNCIIPESFFTTPYQEIPEEIINQYKLKNWIQTILQNN